MSKTELLGRLDKIGAAVAETGAALAVLGLGSVGVQLDRIDQWSDLDLWVIVEEGHTGRFLDDLGWLEAVSPIGYKFRHGSSGYSVLFADGVFAEVDAFEINALPSMSYSEARIVWKAEGVDESIRLAGKTPQRDTRSLDGLLGEALTNVYVGLGRFYRGEKLTAMRFIQVYAVDRILEMAPLIEEAQPGWRDVFGNERRFERRYPGVAQELPCFLQGYERTPESAAAILDFLDSQFTIDEYIKGAIRGLLAKSAHKRAEEG